MLRVLRLLMQSRWANQSGSSRLLEGQRRQLREVRQVEESCFLQAGERPQLELLQAFQADQVRDEVSSQPRPL